MAELRTRFVGTNNHGLDDKGRMVLPAKVRGQLGETGMIGMADRCLGLWTVDGFDEITDKLAEAVEAGQIKREVLQKFTALAVEVTPDAQGRVIIPQVLRTYAGLGSEVVVNGARSRVEIWARETWESIVGSEPSEVQENTEDVREAFATMGI